MTQPIGLYRCRSWRWMLLIAGASIAFSAAGVEVLFHDDFEGAQLDASKWEIETSGRLLGRTSLGAIPTVANGVVSLHLAMYSPKFTGYSFRGTEIRTLQAFPRGRGLEFEARMRVFPNTPSGIVHAFFTFAVDSQAETDEISFELVTRDNETIVGSFNDWVQPPILSADTPNNDTTHRSTKLGSLPGVNRNEFNTYTIRWLPDRMEWLVNGVLVHSQNQVVADEPMNLRLNFWVPMPYYKEAFDPNLKPVKQPTDDPPFCFDVDFVTVRSIP